MSRPRNLRRKQPVLQEFSEESGRFGDRRRPTAYLSDANRGDGVNSTLLWRVPHKAALNQRDRKVIRQRLLSHCEIHSKLLDSGGKNLLGVKTYENFTDETCA